MGTVARDCRRGVDGEGRAAAVERDRGRAAEVGARHVTDIPTPPLAGLNVVIVGAGTTVNLFELVAVPPAVVTVILPLLAAAGTVA